MLFIIIILIAIVIFLIREREEPGYNSNSILNSLTPHYEAPIKDFPETDINGKQLLTTYHEAITGVTKIYDGVDPQSILLHLKPGQDLLLEADPKNKYDKFAVKVLTTLGEQIGWIPRECYATNLQQDISDRLINGFTVLAKVKAITGGTNSKPTYGCVIDIARYSKQ